MCACSAVRCAAVRSAVSCAAGCAAVRCAVRCGAVRGALRGAVRSAVRCGGVGVSLAADKRCSPPPTDPLLNGGNRSTRGI